MKKILLLLASMTAILMGCNKEDAPDTPSASKDATVTINFSGINVTKATGINNSDESAVSSAQVLIFDASGKLEGYKSVTGIASAVAVKTTQGIKDVYAYINCPDLSEVNTKSELLGKTASLSDNAKTALQMEGHKSVTVSSSSVSATINMTRRVAKIAIDKITRNMAATSPALASKSFTITGIYVVNVPAAHLYSSETPTLWYNQRKNAGNLTALLSDTVSASLADSKSYTTKHTFYVFPNPTSTDSNSATWSARHTRLVVEAKMDGETTYYPITLPVIEANHTYTCTELVITRAGSNDPDVPIETISSGVTLKIDNWVETSYNEEI